MACWLRAQVPEWILVLGGAGIVAGLATYGYKIMRVLGVKAVKVTNARGFCLELSTAITVVIASRYGARPRTLLAAPRCSGNCCARQVCQSCTGVACWVTSSKTLAFGLHLPADFWFASVPVKVGCRSAGDARLGCPVQGCPCPPHRSCAVPFLASACLRAPRASTGSSASR